MRVGQRDMRDLESHASTKRVTNHHTITNYYITDHYIITNYYITDHITNHYIAVTNHITNYYITVTNRITDYYITNYYIAIADQINVINHIAIADSDHEAQ